jgi:hypothetical protein
VWSVWSKPVALYISATCSMLKAPKQPALVVPHPATLPLDRVLSRITEAASDSSSGYVGVLKKAKLQVTLGGSVCPPLICPVPAGVNSWQELKLIADASAAQQLGIAAADLVCEWSPNAPGLLSAMPLWWMQSLQEWAGKQQAKVASIQPLWAVATACKLARQRSIQGLCIVEGDGAVSLTSPHIASDDVAILKMKFSPSVQPLLQHGPKAWATHWQLA